MIEVTKDIWEFSGTHWIVIPTNEGYNSVGENVMGRGLAKQAADKFPDLSGIYGGFLTGNPGVQETWPIILNDIKLLMFPTKPLNVKSPAMSWRSRSSINLIKAAANHMFAWHEACCKDDLIALPALGCGLGGLSLNEVLPVLHSTLPGDRFVLVHERPF